jgi:predicted lipoprotein with Yx(FWY)xxD motif
MKRPLALLILAVALGATGATAYALTASVPAKARRATKVSLRQTTLGKVLVDRRGRTLYLFMKDARRKSRCGPACASAWPPVTTKRRPRAGGGVRARRLGSIRRSDGSRQVTYFGHPLYRFIGDGGPGETNGQGLKEFGARWYAVRASGTRAGAVKPQATPPPYPTGY